MLLRTPRGWLYSPQLTSYPTPLSPPLSSQPKAANVLGAVNKPLASAGKQLQSKASRMETASTDDSPSSPSSPQRAKARYAHTHTHTHTLTHTP